MKFLRDAFVALGIFALTATPAAADQLVFQAVINAGQEVPTNDSNGQGVGFVTYDTTTGELCSSITFDGLSGTAVAAHFHAPGEPGVNAGIVIDLSSALPSPMHTCTTGVSAAFLRQLQDGLVYFNVHTALNPGGEIRGQLERVGGSRPVRAGRLPILR